MIFSRNEAIFVQWLWKILELCERLRRHYK